MGREVSVVMLFFAVLSRERRFLFGSVSGVGERGSDLTLLPLWLLGKV